MRPNPKIGWILSGNEITPGARILGFNIHHELRRLGHESEILFSPETYSLTLPTDAVRVERLLSSEVDVLVFQKVYEGDAENLARRAREAGIRTIYLACELCGENMIRACDACIAVSQFLKDAMPMTLHRKITVVGDAIEVPENVFKKDYNIRDRRPRGAYIGSSYPSVKIRRMLQPLSEQLDVRLITNKYSPDCDNEDQARYGFNLVRWLSQVVKSAPLDLFRKTQRRIGYMRAHRKTLLPEEPVPEESFTWVPWSRDTVFDRILECDVGLVPCELSSDHHLSKSANRITTFMALGLPVIASPLPAYSEIIEHGTNGFLANSPDEWKAAIRQVLTPGCAERIASRGRSDITKTHSAAVIARKYLKVFTGS